MAESLIVNMADSRQKLSLLTAIRSLDQGEWRFEWCRYRSRRSDPQNRYFHGVVLPIIGDAVRALGNEYSDGEIKEMLKEKFLKREVMDKSTGEIIGVTIGKTSRLDTAEFNAFIEDCSRWAAEILNVVIPDPA